MNLRKHNPNFALVLRKCAANTVGEKLQNAGYSTLTVLGLASDSIRPSLKSLSNSNCSSPGGDSFQTFAEVPRARAAKSMVFFLPAIFKNKKKQVSLTLYLNT